MGTIVPRPLTELVRNWRLDGSPSQPGMTWPRQRWIEAFPMQSGRLQTMPDLLDRAALRQLCDGASVDADAAEAAFIAVMAWGYGAVGYGPFRTRNVLATTLRASDRLAAVARAIREDGAISAYEHLANAGDCRLRGLGPAFGTKYLSFCQPPGMNPSALILDALVSTWLRREAELGLDSVAWSVGTYRRYLNLMHEWASLLDCRPEELEYCIFRAMSTERGTQWGDPSALAPESRSAPLGDRHSLAKGAADPGTRRPRPAAVLASAARAELSRPERNNGATDRAAKFREDIYSQLVDAASTGRTVCYSDLPGGRGHIGSYLYRIADHEKENGRPPLTALVVRKTTGRPGEGFAIAARQVGYIRPGESDDDVWERAVAEVFAFWSRSGDSV